MYVNIQLFRNSFLIGLYIHNLLLPIHLKFHLRIIIFLKHNFFFQFSSSMSTYAGRKSSLESWSLLTLVQACHRPSFVPCLPSTFFIPATWTPHSGSTTTSCCLNVACSNYAPLQASEPHIPFSPPEVPWPVLSSSVGGFFIPEINHGSDHR